MLLQIESETVSEQFPDTKGCLLPGTTLDGWSWWLSPESKAPTSTKREGSRLPKQVASRSSLEPVEDDQFFDSNSHERLGQKTTPYVALVRNGG